MNPNKLFFKDSSFTAFIHRGGAEDATENTLDAFQYSANLGFVFMETDVQSTKDGKIVVFHDCYKGTDKPHPDSFHGGLPVIRGEKWAFNLWFRKDSRINKI